VAGNSVQWPRQGIIRFLENVELSAQLRDFLRHLVFLTTLFSFEDCRTFSGGFFKMLSRHSSRLGEPQSV
jgi:hypothetical protein